MIIKEFNFLLKNTKSASDIKNSLLPQLNLKAITENVGYIAKVYDTQSKKMYLLVSDSVKTEKSLSDNIFEIGGGNSSSECSSSALLNGSVTLKGIGSPSSNSSLVTDVNNGDTYLDTNTNEVYIKTNTTWQKINTEITDLNGSPRYPKVESNAVFGEIGGLGAGVAYLPEIAATVGLTPMNGANDRSNENFGNFVDSNENVFVCIPLMYYKADTENRNAEFGNKPNIYISYVPKEGYAPFYAFKKSNGEYVPCVFVSKYLMGITRDRSSRDATQRAISKKNQDVTTSHQNTSSYTDDISIAKISGCEARNDNFFKAAKSMNSNTVLHYAALRFVYYMVAEAHMQAAVRKFGSISKVPSSICAYLDVEPYFPKGCFKNNLGDIYDKSIKYEQGLLSAENCGMTGSCNMPEKTSFNGQKCGIVDMGGLMDEVDAGYIVTETGTYTLKGIDLLKSLDEETFMNTENYIELDLTNRRQDKFHNVRVGNGENPIFSFSYPDPNNKDAVNEYNCDNFLNPLSEGMSEPGTTAYGQDFNSKLEKNYAPVFGGAYGNIYGYSSGLLYFYGLGHEWSNNSNFCSARAMIVPEKEIS